MKDKPKPSPEYNAGGRAERSAVRKFMKKFDAAGMTGAQVLVALDEALAKRVHLQSIRAGGGGRK